MKCEYCGCVSNEKEKFITLSHIEYLMNYKNPKHIVSNVDINKKHTLCKYTWCQSKFFGRVTEGEGVFIPTINAKLIKQAKKEKEEKERLEKEKEEEYEKEWRERANEYKKYKALF